MALPDFLVAGVPKAGTTALHAALSRHPVLYLSPVKEPKFFLSDGPPPTKGGPGDALTYREHIWRRDRYEALFEAAPAGALRGESTPLYLYDPAAIRRSSSPHARMKSPTGSRPADHRWVQLECARSTGSRTITISLASGSASRIRRMAVRSYR
jgi:hypothetical protein